MLRARQWAPLRIGENRLNYRARLGLRRDSRVALQPWHGDCTNGFRNPPESRLAQEEIAMALPGLLMLVGTLVSAWLVAAVAVRPVPTGSRTSPFGSL